MKKRMNLYDKIMKASNVIHKANLKGSGNFMIISPKVAEIIENLDIRKYRRKKLEKLNEIMKKRDSE